ncbi:MAG TPA: hypothetical protein VM325_03595 [Alphaproteobacteria bacterium]|nr:hypothetical protein [Alphaproteobacteria bacterium]
MTDERKTQLRGRGLWKSLPRDPVGQARPGGPSEPSDIDGWDANLLAAHLDGRLSAREREMLEAKLDDNPLLLATLLAAHGGERAETGPPPELIDAAKAIGRGSADNGGGSVRMMRSPANENQRGRIAWLEWAAAAAAIVVVSAIGFELGSDSGRGGKTMEVAAKKSETLDFDLEGNFFSTSFTLDEADDAFNGDGR